MKKKPGHPPKHPALRLQVVWWSHRILKMWGKRGRRALVAALSRVMRREIRDRFLHDALTQGTEPQSKLRARLIRRYVKAGDQLEGCRQASVGFESARFLIGEPETFTIEGAQTLLAKLFKKNGMERLTSRETFHCERLRIEYGRAWRSMPDQHCADCARSWAIGRVGALRDEMYAGDWLATVALLFREAAMLSDWVYASELRSALREEVNAAVDRLFSHLPKYAQKAAVEPYKESIFGLDIDVVGGKVGDLHRAAASIGGAILPAAEVRERREVLALSQMDDWAAKQLMTKYAKSTWCEIAFDLEARNSQFGNRLFDSPEPPEPNRTLADGSRISRFVCDEKARAMLAQVNVSEAN
jgi:hypothetical protein